MTVKEKAPAKLNLGLRILGKRDDGFHNILSIFQTVGLCDELTLTSSTETGIECDNAGVPKGDDNLILRAEDKFRKYSGISSPVRFILKKRIPVGAGLGGGSSDAAASLRGLKDFHGAEIQDNALSECAAELGSDIPFLLRGGTAIVSGRGECADFVEWPFDFTYVIVYPGFGVPTAWAYGNIDNFFDDGGVYRAATEKLKEENLEAGEFFNALRNDFEPVVFGKHTALKEIKTSLMERGASAALLTGSGSAMFGIFEEKKDAEKCARLFKNDFTDVFTVRACS